jgi:hypothetical protein
VPAALLIAFVGPCAICAPITLPALVFASTLESAVPSGDGEACLSLPSLSTDREFDIGSARVLEADACNGCDGEGDADFRLKVGNMTGIVNMGVGRADTDGGWVGSEVVAFDVDVVASGEDDAGVSNSIGRTRGVA